MNRRAPTLLVLSVAAACLVGAPSAAADGVNGAGVGFLEAQRAERARYGNMVKVDEVRSAATGTEVVVELHVENRAGTRFSVRERSPLRGATAATLQKAVVAPVVFPIGVAEGVAIGLVFGALTLVDQPSSLLVVPVVASAAVVRRPKRALNAIDRRRARDAEVQAFRNALSAARKRGAVLSTTSAP